VKDCYYEVCRVQCWTLWYLNTVQMLYALMLVYNWRLFMCKSFLMIYRQTLPVDVSRILSGVSRHHPYTFQRHPGDCQSGRGSNIIKLEQGGGGVGPTGNSFQQGKADLLDGLQMGPCKFLTTVGRYVWLWFFWEGHVSNNYLQSTAYEAYIPVPALLPRPDKSITVSRADCAMCEWYFERVE
jgi:hypothetical protein